MKILHNLNYATIISAQKKISVTLNGCVVISDEKIIWVGNFADIPLQYSANPRVDLEGRWITPGLVDCHTHMVFAGDRADEFQQRMSGIGYEVIAKQGGGIQSTVRATRDSSEAELLQISANRIRYWNDQGVTTVEIKSGYGLDLPTELKILRVIQSLKKHFHGDIAATFLGAHTIPTEYKHNRQGYVDLLCGQMIPAIKLQGIASSVDAYCETIGFTVDETRSIFECAQQHGLSVKVHAEQLSEMGASKLALEFDALSCDHIEYLEGLSTMMAMDSAHSRTVGVLLPGAFYNLRQNQKPNVALLREHNVTLAVATDYNPGTSPQRSLLLAANQACVLFGLTLDEAFAGVTCNAAQALGLNDRGRLQPGMLAHIAVWDIPTINHLIYETGHNPCHSIFVGENQFLTGQQV